MKAISLHRVRLCAAPLASHSHIPIKVRSSLDVLYPGGVVMIELKFDFDNQLASFGVLMLLFGSSGL